MRERLSQEARLRVRQRAPQGVRPALPCRARGRPAALRVHEVRERRPEDAAQVLGHAQPAVPGEGGRGAQGRPQDHDPEHPGDPRPRGQDQLGGVEVGAPGVGGVKVQ